MFSVVTISNAHDIELRDMDIMYAKSIALTADNVTRVLIQVRGHIIVHARNNMEVNLSHAWL